MLIHMRQLDRSLTESEQLHLVRRVVESSLFRRSQRLREMLNFIAEQTVSQHRQVVREQEIGVAIFGRHESYDTSLDNIVRVTASELRRRLERYFETEGAAEEYVVELPRGGGYVLQYFRREGGSLDPSVPDKPVEELPRDDLSSPTESKVTLDASDIDPHRERDAKRWPPLALAACALLSICAASLAWQVHALKKAASPWQDQSATKKFWGSFFAGQREADVVVGDSSLMMEQELRGSKASLDEYLSNSYRFHSASIDDPGIRRFIDLMHSHNTGAIADFEVAKKVFALAPKETVVRFGSARDYIPEEVRNHNLVLIGSRTTNPWVDLFKDRLMFSIERELSTGVTVIRDRAARPGEQSTYQTNSNDGQSTVYSVIAYIPNLDKSSTALLIGGSDSQGTKAAGDFISSESGLQQIYDRLQGASHFQVLLRSSRVAGTTLRTEIVEVRSEQ